MASWEAVAHTLASRLMHSAFCGQHGPDDRDEDCPFCNDIEAYEAYRDKCREMGRLPMAVSLMQNAVLVPLEEVLRQPRG